MMDNQFVSCVPTAIRVEQMRLVRNCIEVKISDSQLNVADFINGLTIEVTSERPFSVNAFWIVKINDLHRDIEKDWSVLYDELNLGKFLSDNQKSLFRSEQKVFYETHKQILCEVKPPSEIDTASMTQTPRDFYPLVIIVACQRQAIDPSDNLESGAASLGSTANIHIVHLKDQIVSIKSHVIKQYIKQPDGRILDISQLYQEESIACFICFEEADEVERIKLFCLLPCRHSPICSNCIPRIRECPKCRCPIASIFDINAPTLDLTSQSVGSGALTGDADRPAIDPSLRHLYNDDDEATNGATPSARRRQEQKVGFFNSLKSMFGI